jgi:hypothetical protein
MEIEVREYGIALLRGCPGLHPHALPEATARPSPPTRCGEDERGSWRSGKELRPEKSSLQVVQVDRVSELEESDDRNVLKRLIALRNKLAHPRPRELDEIKAEGQRWRFDEYSPLKAAEFVTAVGNEAYTLSHLHEAMPLSATAYLVVVAKERILEFGKNAEAAPERGADRALSMEDLQEILTQRLRSA